MEILYSDPSILVVNKPAGVSVLPDGWEKDSTYLLQQLEGEYGKLWVVHRLDKVTSGVMIFARNGDAHRALNLQFEGREVKKIYHAILTGLPPWDEHTAKHPLRVNVGHSHRTTVDITKGKPSETHFRIRERFTTACLVEASPKTGRTHQIRVHAYALGFPLLGDSLYSAPETNLIKRPALHAHSIEFQHPFTGEPLAFSALYPPDFEQALAALRKAAA